jgi:hypothetical protein
MEIRAIAAALLTGALCLPASAATLAYTASLSGMNEDPVQITDGTGSATVTIDTDLLSMEVNVTFADLTGNATAAHIHCCTTAPGTGNVGVATPVPAFPGFPVGGTAGAYDQTFDLTQSSSFNPSFVAANGGTTESAASALLAGLAQGRTYFNIHTTFVAGGEIRGFLVPEPATSTLLGAGLAALVLRRRSR